VSGVVKEPNEAQINMSSKGNIGIWTNPTGEHTKDKRQTYIFTKQQNIDTQKVFMNL
jgi:hypothetical protein